MFFFSVSLRSLLFSDCQLARFFFEIFCRIFFHRVNTSEKQVNTFFVSLHSLTIFQLSVGYVFKVRSNIFCSILAANKTFRLFQAQLSKGMDPHSPIKAYFEQMFHRGLANSSSADAHLAKVFSGIQSNLVPKSRLREWAITTYEDPTDYFTFRKHVSRNNTFCSYEIFSVMKTTANSKLRISAEIELL